MTAATVTDLAQAGQGVDSVRCEVCVVGAGAAGSYLARRLGELGVDVVVLEAGGQRGEDPTSSGFDVTCPRGPYPGATEGRAFGLGGSTSRWGGLLVPHSRHDLRPDGDPVGCEALERVVEVAERRAPAVLSRLGFQHAPEFEEYSEAVLKDQERAIRQAGLAVVTSLFLPFRKKNLYHLLEGNVFAAQAPRIFTNAPVYQWSVEASGRIAWAEAGRGGGDEDLNRPGREAGEGIRVVADRYVICAGALESARILLEIERALPDGRSLSPDLGVGLGDHLSVAIADVAPASRALATDRYAPRFAGSWMRSFRFMEANPPLDTPRSFSHFVFDNENPGFRLAKNVLTSLQARRLPRVRPSEAVAGVGGAIGIATNRFLRSRLFVPSDTPTRLQLDVEQDRSISNRIVLGKDLDRSGRPAVTIEWKISDRDMQNLRAASERLLDGWSRETGPLPELVPRDLSFDSEKPHDAYHPVGVCRMGTDDQSVVDRSLRVRGLENVWVLSTGVMPTAGTANPTFSLLCLAEELATSLR